MHKNWVGVDLDGTLAEWWDTNHPEGWDGEGVNAPVHRMVEMVKRAIDRGLHVKICTARVGPTETPERIEKQTILIQDWCEKHIGRPLEVTASKDPYMLELWDDRAVRISRDEGTLCEQFYDSHIWGQLESATT